MKGKFLIDTSAWIESFRKSGNKRLQSKVIESLDSGLVATANIVVLELLQGCRDSKEYKEMKERLESLELLSTDEKVWDTAYNAGFSLRRNGITVPTVDIIIASISKAHGYTLIHHDGHLRVVAKHIGLPAIDFLDD